MSDWHIDDVDGRYSAYLRNDGRRLLLAWYWSEKDRHATLKDAQIELRHYQSQGWTVEYAVMGMRRRDMDHEPDVVFFSYGGKWK